MINKTKVKKIQNVVAECTSDEKKRIRQLERNLMLNELSEYIDEIYPTEIDLRGYLYPEYIVREQKGLCDAYDKIRERIELFRGAK